MKRLSLFAVILLMFTTLTACGRPSDADELLQFGIEAANAVESYSSDFNATLQAGGVSYELTGSLETVTTPELALKYTFNVGEKEVITTYTGGKLYLGSKEVPVSEDEIAAIEAMIGSTTSYEDIIALIDAESLSYVKNDDSYTLNFSLDPALSKDYIVEKLQGSQLLTELESAAVENTEVDIEAIDVNEISFEYELDKDSYHVISGSANLVIGLGEKEFSIAIETSNFVYNEITEITAP